MLAPLPSSGWVDDHHPNPAIASPTTNMQPNPTSSCRVTRSTAPTFPVVASPKVGGVETVFAAFCAAGLWPGLGRATAERLAAAGINSPDDVTTTALLAIDGIGAKKAEKLAKAFVEAQPRYAVAEMLHAAGLPVRAAVPIVGALGGNAAAALARDPWRLLDTGMVEPRQADAFALRTLTERPAKTDPRRGRAFTAYVLARAARDGHTVLAQDTLAAALGGLDVPDPAAAIEAAVDDGVAVRDVDLVGLTRYAMAEEAVAEGLARLLASAEPLGRADGVIDGLDPAQQEAVREIAAHGVCVLHGGPGTGKSRTVAAVVDLAKANNKRIALAAPTGRAAKRLEELTGHDAQTLHRLLGAQRGGQDGESQFLRGESWPIDADIVVVDETSMLDVELAAALLDACADGTHLLVVGDPAQLPSIGPGRVLGDILDSGAIPAVELTILHRQAEGGSIARLAGEVRTGTLPRVDDPTREVVLVPASSSAEAAHRVVQLVTDAIPRALSIPAADVQVVTPVHRGPAGTQALNAVLKQKLNPGSGTLQGFDVGDRVVATANHLDDGFANGEVGVVTGIVDGSLMVDFAGGPVVVPPKAISDLVHGWAVTVHRAQGSEWPAVVMVLPPEASGMLSRPLVYTALTRAQLHLSIVHAAGAAVARGVRDVDARPRRTRLANLLGVSS
jgi:exodeoxyribonuclease V alpha subunit